MWHGLVSRLVEHSRISKMMKGARIIPAAQNTWITRSNWVVMCQQILSQDMFEQDGMVPAVMIYTAGRVTSSTTTLEIQLYNATTGQFMLSQPLQITSTTNVVVSSEVVDVPVDPCLVQIVARRIGTGFGIINCVQMNIFNRFVGVLV